jgi:uncharacterized protein (DUF1501 family)
MIMSAQLLVSYPHAATRRELLLGSGALFAWAFVPKIARAEGRDPRFLTIVLRGALDGLAAVAPVGDPDWVNLRGAIVVHAVATPYRERSHFDGQDVLESGLARPGRADTGWLNRALVKLEPDDRVRTGTNGRRTFAVGPITPLVVRGPAPVLSWVPPRLPPVSDDTTTRLLDLYRHSDPKLAHVLEERISLASLGPAGSSDRKPGEMGPAVQVGNINQVRAYFAEAAGAAAKFLANPDGPRVGALALDGWDTHNNEGVVNGRLAQLLSALDAALGAVETNMGAAWSETVVTLITEFGRTARINGTAGTDHGTATVALLLGGALKGGRVIADWPGLKEADLHDNRDLKATTDLRAVLKSVLKDHLRVPDRALAETIFPDSAAARPLEGLVG